MQVIEHTADRLVLRDRSLLMGGVLGVGAILSVVTVIATAVYGWVDLAGRETPPSFFWLRLFILGLVFVLGCVMAGVGGVTALHVLRGMTCVFDRPAETVTITQPDFLSKQIDRHSIYGVSHAHVERSDDVQAFAIFLVLRTGQRIPLAVQGLHDEALVEETVHRIRSFLRSR